MRPFQRTAWIGFLFMLSAVSAETFDADSVLQIDRERGDRNTAQYFSFQVASIEQDCLSEIQSAADWPQLRDKYRQQLRDMLGLDPLPERTPLQATIVDTVERDGVVVEKIHFQSLPGLYVTGNLYRPPQVTAKAPTILYVCGHGRVIENGVSYGNKVHYQHHGVWFARHGYVCLVIDTVQLGEIQGLHHGTYRHGHWWWNARGYTPAGVEAWNSMRALDYLVSRDDVDAGRIGVTGRSGGGIYSWWLATLDDRVQVAVPVAGITTLWNHVVDDCVEGHCDCMYQINTQRWDYPQIAALVAPRPLLISNTDKDSIFPLAGVVDVHRKTRRIYDLLGASDKLGLHITAGPHQDTQELRIHAFRWLNRFLKQDDTLIDTPAKPLFEAAELKVFAEIPADEINTTVHETFVPPAETRLPANKQAWEKQRDKWIAQLRQRCFAGWTTDALPSRPRLIQQRDTSQGRLLLYEYNSESLVDLPLFIWMPSGLDAAKVNRLRLNVLDENTWLAFAAAARGDFGETPPEGAQAWLAPRGVGPTAWTDDDRERTHIRRRFVLIGQSLDGMRVWDVRRAVAMLRELHGEGLAIEIRANDDMAGVALYASLFEPAIDRTDLVRLAASHRDGPIFLNVLRILDVPQAVTIAAEKSQVTLHEADKAAWQFPLAVQRNLGWPPDRLQFVP